MKTEHNFKTKEEKTNENKFFDFFSVLYLFVVCFSPLFHPIFSPNIHTLSNNSYDF